MIGPIDVLTARASVVVRAIHAIAELPTRLGGQHMPRRPQWTCDTCPTPDTPWPCSPALTRLAEYHEGDVAALATYLGALDGAARVDRSGARGRAGGLR